MASAHPQSNPGDKITRYCHAAVHGKRAKVSIGKRTLKSAVAISDQVTEIELSIASGLTPPQRATDFIESLPEKISNRFRKLGIIGDQLAVPSMPIQDLIDGYIGLWGAGVTKSTLDHAIDRLKRFKEFCDKSGVSRSSGITDALLVRYRSHLMASSKPSTVKITMRRVKHMLKTAFQAGLMSTWVGEHVQSATSSEKVRCVHIHAEWAGKLLGCIDDPELAITVALARYAGLRIPSELDMLWADISTAGNPWYLHVRNVKTVRHGAAIRRVPVFPELKELLNVHHRQRYGVAVDECKLSSDHIVDAEGLRRASGGLSQHLDRDGVWDRWEELWSAREFAGTGFFVGVHDQPIMDSEPYTLGTRIPRCFQACRQSFANDLLDRKVPIQVAASVLGHTIQTLAKHYAQINASHDSYFAED